MRATFKDVLDGCAHMVGAHGEIMRASVPAMFNDDPDAAMETIVIAYPHPGLPDCQEVFRFQPTTVGRVLAREMRRRGYVVQPRMDD